MGKRRKEINNDFVVFLVGPTAVGKSDIAVALAKKIGGEIVSCDSMQVYRGMDIGTAKPSPAQRRRVPHHLIDIADPSRLFNVAMYRRRALRAIADILRRKKVPIVVGGTGLYFRALLDGLFEGPGRDMKLRACLEREAKTFGSVVLYQRLLTVDPGAAKKIHPNDVRKIVRALEVYHASQKPISTLQTQWNGKSAFPYPFIAFGLDMDRPELYRRVDLRVQKMFRDGLKQEVQALLKKKFTRNPTAWQAIGYKEVVAWLQGVYDRRKAMELVQRNSRRFAKRQFTWFKKDARIEWVKVYRNTSRDWVVRRLLQVLAQKKGRIGS